MTSAIVLGFTTGLLGGFGHCAAMCGPLVGSLGLVAAPRVGPRRALLGQLLYNAGRVTTYAFVGGVMGLTGSFVNVAGRLAGLQDAVAIGAGLLMMLMGLGAAGLSAWARGLERRAADRVLRAVRLVVDGGGAGRLYVLGLVLGFLPCGLSWSAFLGSAATGDAPRGVLFALAFAGGTVPALLAVGTATTLASARWRGRLQRAGGLVVVIVGALFLARGLGVHAPL